jgi:diacylglycerol O-acyltransferase
VQAVTTNVPGPRFPLYVLGKRMVSAYAYVPIAGGTRCSIGIFSYQNTMTFGLNADFDGYPDLDTLSGGIRRGLDELLTLAKQQADTAKEQPKPTPANSTAATTTPAQNTPAKTAAPKKKTAAAAQQ